MPPAKPIAFGAPGSEPRWTHSAKEGVGTAYNSNSRVWFTLSHGILNEIYWPHVDTPNTRDCQFLISDGESFCHEEKRDLLHEISYPEQNCLLYRIINTEPTGRYRLVKHVLSDPHRSVVLMHTRLDIFDEALRAPGKLRLYVLLAPHMAGRGAGNSGSMRNVGAYELLHAFRDDAHLVMGCEVGFSRRSMGYVGASDGWQDLMDNFEMDWEFAAAENGNIALTAEVNLARAGKSDGASEFTIAIGFGDTAQSAGTATLQSLASSFEEHRAAFIRQWQRAALEEQFNVDASTGDGGSMYRLSRCILLAHEDKAFEGALIAALSTPWGETKSDDDLGGYHLVWTRDMVQSATALLATGQTETPLRALIWLSCIQEADGGFPQNSWIDGREYWSGIQLDEVAAPLLLAWRLRRADALQRFDPWPMMARAAAYLIAQGPVTAQERWEENSGYSPSTLATVIAGLVCAAEFAPRDGGSAVADFLLVAADWLAAHVEDWTVTHRGELVEGKPRHYVRITPADPNAPDPHPDADTLEVQLANGGGKHAARNVVGGDFLQLVRLGICAADDPIVRDSLEVIDRALRYELPQGPGWRRYSHDGYGQKEDGSAYDGTGVGRCWPILTGERGQYEIAAGRDSRAFVDAMEKFANEGGMISEQLWDAPDSPEAKMKLGAPTGAAMPLCWSHAEYVSLVRSRSDGVVFDRIEPAFERFVRAPVASAHELWSLRHRTRRMSRGKTLRLIVQAEAEVRWTADHWHETNEARTEPSGLPGIWFVDLPTKQLPIGATIEFTFLWLATERWQGENFRVEVVE